VIYPRVEDIGVEMGYGSLILWWYYWIAKDVMGLNIRAGCSGLVYGDDNLW